MPLSLLKQGVVSCLLFFCGDIARRNRYHDELASQEYEAVVREVLCKGVVDDEGRAKLRAHREAHGIDWLDHIYILSKLGWSYDDLEEGRIVDSSATSLARFKRTSQKFKHQMFTRRAAQQLAEGSEANQGQAGKTTSMRFRTNSRR